MPKHTCRALVITCIDFRFVSSQRDFLLGLGLENNYDLLTTPGASKNLLQIEGAIAASLRLHEPKEILIFDHEDCGAYGENNSFEAHRQNLLKAQLYLEKTYPKVKGRLFISSFGQIKEIN